MKKGSKLSAISVCTCIAFAGNVNAEDTAEEQQLERVSIVGSKVNRTRQELSNSIGFFGEYRLQNDNIFSVEDIFDRTANTFTGTTGFGSYSIRGVNNNGIVSGISNANALSSIVLNQVALGVNSGDYIKPGLFDAQSVEIFRGPQSTVQGPNSLIGAIYINFAKPEFDQGFEGKARVQTGQLDTLNAAVAQNLVLVDDYLAARISFETRQTDGDVVNTTTGRDDVQRLDENALRLGIKAQPFGDESLVFDLTYFNVDSDSNPFGLVSNETGDLFDRIQVVDVDDEYPFDFEQFGLEAQWQINDHWSFTSITGYNEIDIAQRFDGDISAFDFLSVVANIDEEIFSQELRLTYDIDDFSVLVGAYYSDGDFGFGFSGSGLFPDPITGDFVPFSTITDNIEVITQQAIFSKVHWDITDDWHLDFGVRLNREERDTDNFADNNGAVSDLSASETFSTVIPSFAVTYDLNSSTSVGVSYARGVQAGGIAFAVFLGQSQPYDEEYTDNYEAFVRYSSEDGEFMVNANVFYVDWTDQQVTTTPAGGFPGFDDLVENAGESSIRGIEVEVEWQATPALMTFASLALNKTEFEAFVLNGVDFSGTRFPQSPKSNFALGFIYQGNSGFYASSTFSYVDSTFTDLQAPQDTEISSRSLLSARVGYEWEDWQFYVWGENLLDDEYELGLFDGSAFGLNSAYGRLGEPRILGIGVDVSW